MRITDYNNCVDKHADAVYRFILKNMRSEHRAQDVVQEAFLKLWEKRKDVAAEKAKSYLFTTAYHFMIDVIRREKKISYQEQYHHSNAYKEPQSESATPHDLQAILNEALSQLPEIQRTVVLLRDYEGYSYDEIGDICQLKSSQVKVYIYRARLKMKQYIGKLEMVI